jgi:Tol biopolymer transport system component
LLVPGALLLAAGVLWAASAELVREGERHFRNVKQLTFGGENAEAYFSADGKKLIFQTTRDGYPADQIYTMKSDGSDVKRVSTGKGRCTCSYFFPDGKRILFSSTHHKDPQPPPRPDYSRGYVWPIYPTYDIFTARPDGSDLRQLTDSPGYDAESTISPDGKRIVFTSTRDGDLDVYVMNIDGTGVRRLTSAVGYDGGAFFSPDGKQICFRAYRPRTPEEIAEYRALLRDNLIRPTKLELFLINADGTGERQITHNGAANFCPFFTHDARRIIFASNMDDPAGRNFDLYLIGVDGTGLERVTTDPTFDGFPMFSPDGKRLVWASNRNSKERGDTNIFSAEWKD